MQHDEDKPAWHFENTGVFSVKSAYKLAFELQINSFSISGGSSMGDDSRKIWNLIWKCKVPNKIRIFAWRCASDNLATKKNKWRRTLEIDSICNICGISDETSYHATVVCPKAKALRHKMRQVWSLPREEDFMYTGPDWLLMLLAKAKKDSHPLILLLLWRAWHLRNNIVHEDGKSSIEASAVFLQNYFDTLNGSGFDMTSKGSARMVTCANQVQLSDHGTPKARWTAPVQGKLKMNVDASFIQETNEGFLGAVIRNQKGTVVCAMAMQLQSCEDAEEAKARALLQALRTCVQQDIRPEEVETDSSTVWYACKEANQNLSKRCYIYREIDRIRKSMFDFNLSKVKRDCNSVAHELAKSCRVEGTVGIWFDSVPT
jgi:ribonuclease HI